MRNLWFKFLFLGIAIILASCSTDDPSELGNLQANLNKNLSKWQLAGPSNYRYNFRRSCFCGNSYIREVMIRYSNFQRDLIVYADDLSPVINSDHPSIDELFVIIQDAIDKQESNLVVNYHPVFGYPTVISRDPILHAVDDEIVYVVDHFQTNGSLYTSAWVVSSIDGLTTAAEFSIDSAEIKLARLGENDFDAIILNINTISSCGSSFFPFYISLALSKSLPPQASSKTIRLPGADDVCDSPELYHVVVDLTPYKLEMIKMGISDVVLNIDSFSLRYQFSP